METLNPQLSVTSLIKHIYIHIYIYIYNSLEEGMAIHSSILTWRIPMDRGAWQAAVLSVEKSWTGLSDAHTLGNSNSDGIDL